MHDRNGEICLGFNIVIDEKGKSIKYEKIKTIQFYQRSRRSFTGSNGNQF
jgi:hypothetical protein